MYSQPTTHKIQPKNLQKNFYPYPLKNISKTFYPQTKIYVTPLKNISKKIPEKIYTTTPLKNISKKIPENFCSQLRSRPVQPIRGGG